MAKAYANINNIVFASAIRSATTYNTDYVTCKSTQATSAEVKCSIASSLVHQKSIASISITSSSFTGYTTDLNLRIDADLAVASNFFPNSKDRMIHVEGKAYWSLAENIITEHDLTSAQLPNGNRIEALIPAASCFNATLKEAMTVVTIPFTATGKLKAFDTDAVIRDVTLTGELIANVLSTDSSELIPCN